MPRKPSPSSVAHLRDLLRVIADSPVPIASYEFTPAGPRLTFFAGKQAATDAPTADPSGQSDGAEDGWSLVTNLAPNEAKWMAPLSDDESAALGDS